MSRKPKKKTAAIPSREPKGWLYRRYSSKPQERGDSIRRQTELALAWEKKTGIPVDYDALPIDEGVSAFNGDNRTDGSLGEFLRLIESGVVLAGDVLLVENLDRLSRENPWDSIVLLAQICNAGVKIQTLAPEMVYERGEQIAPLLLGLVELSRSHGESSRKSDNVASAWKQKKRAAAAGKPQPKLPHGSLEGSALMSRRVPAWVEVIGGKAVAIPSAVIAVKRVFALSAAGYGSALIVRKLTDEKVKAIGTSGTWGRAYVSLLLSDRRVLGELQPYLSDGNPDGDVIKNYYPQIITPAEFDECRGGAAERMQKRGRVSERVDLFSGLMVNARDGGSYYVATRTDGGKHSRVLINTAAAEGLATCWSFPLPAFEGAVLSCLREIDPAAILAGARPDETLALSGELATVEARIAGLEAELLVGDVAAIGRVLRALEPRAADLKKRLAVARRKAPDPLSRAWLNAKGLLETLATSADVKDARLRLRAEIGRVVESITLLVVPRGRDRFCAVQLRFVGSDRTRSYLILSRPTKSNRTSSVKGGAWALSFADAGLSDGDLDLRRGEYAGALAEELETYDVEKFIRKAEEKAADELKKKRDQVQ